MLINHNVIWFYFYFWSALVMGLNQARSIIGEDFFSCDLEPFIHNTGIFPLSSSLYLVTYHCRFLNFVHGYQLSHVYSIFLSLF